MKYVNSVLGRFCYEELSTLFAKCNNPAKEITESYGALHHMRRASEKDGLKLDDFFNIHIGDGSTARTGAMFTFMNKSANVSVDPQTNIDFVSKWSDRYNVENFNSYRCTWQDYTSFPEGKYISNFGEDLKRYDKPHLGIVLVHSHVKTIDVMRAFPLWKYVYVNKCCKPKQQILTTQQMEENDISAVVSGHDVQILSEQNFVVVYRNNKMFKEG